MRERRVSNVAREECSCSDSPFLRGRLRSWLENVERERERRLSRDGRRYSGPWVLHCVLCRTSFVGELTHSLGLSPQRQDSTDATRRGSSWIKPGTRESFEWDRRFFPRTGREPPPPWRLSIGARHSTGQRLHWMDVGWSSSILHVSRAVRRPSSCLDRGTAEPVFPK